MSRSRTSVQSWILWVGVLLLLFLAGYQSRRAAIAELVPALLPSPASLALGDVWEQESLELTIPVTNQSRHPIEIVDIERGCDCTSVQPSQVRIPGGETATLSARIDLSHLSWAANQKTQPLRLSLTPRLSGSDQSRPVWTITGTVHRNPIRGSRDEIIFHSPLLSGQTPPSEGILLTLDDASACEEWIAEVEPPEMGAAVITPVKGTAKARLTIRPGSLMDKGPFTFRVRVQARRPGERDLVSRSFRVQGSVEHDVEARPSTVDFGLCEIGSQGSAEVTLSAKSGRRIRIVSITPGDAGVSIQPTANELAPQIVLTVSRRTEALGETEVKFQIEVETATKFDLEPQPPVIVVARYRGLPAATTDPGEEKANVAD